MADKKKVLAGAGTLARTEKAQTTGELSFPVSDFTTNQKPGQGRVADLLGHGQSAAVPLRLLVSITGLEARAIRRRIEMERRQGIQILSDNKSGYFLPAEEREVTACVGSLRRRAGEILRTARAIEEGRRDDGRTTGNNDLL